MHVGRCIFVAGEVPYNCATAGPVYDASRSMRASVRATALVLVFAGVARADTPALRVSLSLTRARGAESCITAHDLAQRVEARLGRSTFVSASQADLFVDAHIAKSSPGWRATIAASHANGDKAGLRELSTTQADCRALDDDLVLVVALAIDPLADTRPPPPSPPPPPPPPERVYIRVVVPAPRPQWSFEAHAQALVLSVPTAATPALELAAVTTPPGAWPIELGAIVSRIEDADVAGHGAALRLALGTAATCPQLIARGHSELAACVGVAIGALIVRPHDLSPASDHDLFAAFATARARGRIRLTSSLDVIAELGGVAALMRRSLYYTALDPTTLQVVRHEVYAEPVVGWLAALGIAMHFP